MTLPILSDADSRALTRRIGGLSIAVAMGVGAVAYGFGYGVGGRSAPGAVGTVAEAAADYTEDWSGYADTAAINDAPEWAYGQFTTLSDTSKCLLDFDTSLTGTPWGGSNAVKRTDKTGAGDPVCGYTLTLDSVITIVPEQWVEVYVLFDSVFDATNDSYKTMFFFSSGPGGYIRFHTEESVEAIRTKGTSADNTATVDEWSCVATGPFLGSYTSSGPGSSSCATEDQRPSATYLYTQAWVRLRFHMITETVDAACDGTFEAWLGSEKILWNTTQCSNNEGNWTGIKFFETLSGGVDTRASHWLGQIKVWTSDPNWTF